VVLALTDEIILGLAAAALTNQVTVGRRWLLAATVLPYALPAVVSSMIRRWIFAPSAGLLKGLLPLFGFDYDNHVWFNYGIVALLHVPLLHVWCMLPIYWTIVSSITPSTDFTLHPIRFFPEHPTPEHYLRLFGLAAAKLGRVGVAEQFGAALFNSLIT
jgi:multiple sugar transport system permease protein